MKNRLGELFWSRREAAIKMLGSYPRVGYGHGEGFDQEDGPWPRFFNRVEAPVESGSEFLRFYLRLGF